MLWNWSILLTENPIPLCKKDIEISEGHLHYYIDTLSEEYYHEIVECKIWKIPIKI